MRRVPAVITASVVALCLAGCGITGGNDAPPTTPVEKPGPTLAIGPVPTGWKDVHSASGLVYSVPPEWESGGVGVPDPIGPDQGRKGGGSTSGDGRDGTDWGSGFVTSANSVADFDYCRSSAVGFSFRLLAGITATVPGRAEDQATSATRSLADSMSRRFTQNGADVDPVEPVKIGVSGVPAWHSTVRGKVRPPRNECTPPVIRVDAIAVSTRTSEGSPASVMFVLMVDEDEPGVIPEETVESVLGSLRYDNSL